MTNSQGFLQEIQDMLDKVSTPVRKRTVKWLGAAAVAALLAGGAVESGLIVPNAAHAENRQRGGE